MNEASVIESVLDHTATVLPGREILIVDGGSTDDTVAIARGYSTVITATGSRGVGLNAAAGAARGNVLLFLHADTRLPVDAAEEIARVLSDHRTVGGAFRLAFEHGSPLATCIAWWVNLRSLAFNVFFGDQALFVRKEALLGAGGFRDWNLMEDLEVLHRLRRFGTLRLARSAVVTSARRHVRNGWFRTVALVWVVTWLYLLGVSPRALAGIYRATNRRRADDD